MKNRRVTVSFTVMILMASILLLTGCGSQVKVNSEAVETGMAKPEAFSVYGGEDIGFSFLYPKELATSYSTVTALFEDGVRTLAGDALHFDYRHSVFTETPGIILSAVLQLTPDGDRAAIRAEMDELMRRRKASQPLEYPSAGSTFKRPKGFYAGTMIDECGLKGAAVGGAEVSEKHAGFIINKDHATFRDVVELIGVVQDTVFREYGVELEPEVKILE